MSAERCFLCGCKPVLGGYEESVCQACLDLYVLSPGGFNG
ncbi:MAG: hypothetical protein [Microvirus sp.]|nr:MAG: hypothetical protein [Microvirus sp.]